MKNPIKIYFHCKECIKEQPDGFSPSDFQNISAGLTDDRSIVVWCERHESIVTIIGTSPAQLH